MEKINIKNMNDWDSKGNIRAYKVSAYSDTKTEISYATQSMSGS